MRISTRIVLSIVCLSLTLASTRAATYFVDNSSGDDGDTGGILDPWETLGKAAQSVTSGDTVYVRATSTPYATFVMQSSGVTFIGTSVPPLI